MSLRVLAAGPLTTVQDLGRPGHRHLGVPLAGALDPVAATLANRLVGNPDGAALLEFTLSGPRLVFERPVRVALTGARGGACLVDAGRRSTAVPHGRPVLLPPGELAIGPLRTGARGWLAIAGGLDVPMVLGSRSTDLRGGFGGLHGRALRPGDRLGLLEPPTLEATTPWAPGWWVEPHDGTPGSPGGPPLPVRFVPAPGVDSSLLRAFAGTPWQAAADSNRQGLRLGGNRLDAPAAHEVSAPVAPGTIQLPPDGQPIVLLADAQTVGGYLRLGHVTTAELPLLAQLRPGAAVHLRPCHASQARRLEAAARARLARIALALEARR